MDVTAATAEVQARGFDYLSSTRILIALNNAKNAFEDFAEWPWLEATASGVSPLTVSDLKYVKTVADLTNNNTLTGVDLRDVVDFDAKYGTTLGTPVWWTIDGSSNRIVAYPNSTTATLQVNYIKFSPELAAGSDVPLIPARYHPVWVDLAVIEAAKDDEDFQDVQLLVQDTNRRLQQIAGVYATRNRQNAPVQAITGASEDW